MSCTDYRFLHLSQSSPADQSEKEDNIPDDALNGSSSFKCSIESTFLVPSFQLSDDCNVSVICDRVETDGKHLVLIDHMKVNDFAVRTPFFLCLLYLFIFLSAYNVLYTLDGCLTELVQHNKR